MTRPVRAATLIVIAKRPVPGRVKTRLVPPLTHDDAARLAGAAIEDTLNAVNITPAAYRLLAFDGDPDGWTPPGWQVCAQPEGDLDRRLVAAFADSAALTGGPALLVGMDTPQLRPDHLAAFEPGRFDACLGLAADGGYWAIGFRDPAVAREAIEGIPMSRDDTGARQLDRLHSLGLRVQLLAKLTDVDTVDTAREVAAAAPHTAFAAEFRRTVADAEVA